MDGTGSYGSDPSGPHRTHAGNVADPRVDSDRPGGYGNTAGAGGYGHSDPSGPHRTHAANVADPRVDSDRSGGYGNTASAGGYGHSDPTGPHDSRMANKLDPRVDTDRAGGYGNTASAGGASARHGITGTTGGGPGPAPNTAGPHSSNMMNKLDPRVDSDMDGSNTYGGTRTHG